MRLLTTAVIVGSLLFVISGCDLLKRKNDEKAAASGSTTTSGATTAKSGSGSSDNGNTGGAAESNDPSKGATAGCTWPDSGSIKKDTTFTKGCTVVAKNNVYVEEGATVTFEEGVKVSFDTDIFLRVEYGKVIVKGTDSAPVVFTSTNKSPAPGDWVGLGFREKTMAGTSLDHLIIEYAGSKTSGGEGSIHVESMRQGGRISITNTTIRSGAQFGLVADDNATFAKFENNTFKENKDGSVRVVAEVPGSFGRGNTFSQPVHVHDSKIDQTTTWPPFDVPVFIEGDISIASDKSIPTLTIADKTVLKMGQGALFEVAAGGDSGALVAKNVTFTSAAPTPAEGDWVGIFISQKSNGTDIENCTFEHFGEDARGGHGGITFYGVKPKDTHGVTIANNTFRKGKQFAMYTNDHDCSPFKNNKAEGVPLCSKEQ